MSRANIPPPRASGFLIALSVLVGAGVGIAYRQPSLGFVAGLAAGSVVAIILFLRDRARGR